MQYGIKIAAGFMLLISLLQITACGKDDTNNSNTGTGATKKPPTVTVTDAAAGITSTSANSGGTITSDGGAPLTASGVCWSTTINPTTASDKTSVGTNVGSFVTAITGLQPNTTYYVRAYATNSEGTTYGPRINFTTLP